MAKYTVLAVWTPEDDFVIAGVLEGDHTCVDGAYFRPLEGGYQRYATCVEAESPQEAERLAFKEATGQDSDEDPDVCADCNSAMRDDRCPHCDEGA